ncbi:unnamed protein product [Ophioblennius macclurei]
MSSSVKSLSVGYNPINESNTFASGDYIHGRITLELSKEIEIQTLSIQMKGKASVLWTENHGKTVVTYSSKNKYFSIKQALVQEGQGRDTVGPGTHDFPFSFQIPAQDLPPSFRGHHGKILYTLKAILSRSMRTDSKAKAEFRVVNRINMQSDPALMAPQHSNIDKKMNFPNKGSVGMDINIDRTGFYQGEGMNVVASVQNKSSRDIRIKYSLYTKHSFFANSRRKLHTKEILKEVGELIPPSAGQTIKKIITIPADLGVSILNCDILRVEYRLKVYLDVKYGSDPEIKFPIVVLPQLTQVTHGEQDHPPSYGFDTIPNFNQYGGASFFDEPPAYTPSAPPLHPPPLSFESSALYPPLNPWNQKS